MSNIFKCICILFFFPFCARANLQLRVLNVTIPSWTAETINGDNVVFSFPLVSSSIDQRITLNEVSVVSTLLLEEFPDIPLPGDMRCLDDDCNYYLDISEVNVQGGLGGGLMSYTVPWGRGGKLGFIGEDRRYYGNGNFDVIASVVNTSIIKIKKRHTGIDAKYPTKSKTVSFKFATCNAGISGASWTRYQSSLCHWGADSPVLGPGIQINVTVPPPTLPKVQCYMSPWSNNIDFQPVTVPVETGRAGAVTWPLSGGTFTGVEKQSSSLSIQCSNIAADVSTLPLKVSLKGNGWEYGNNGELFFGTERNIAVATALKMSANTGSLALDNDGSGCDAYWKNTGNNNFEMGALSTGNYLMNGGNQCSFTHQLPAPHSVMEEFRFTVDAILGVSTATATKTPEYRKHQGALMLEVSIP